MFLEYLEMSTKTAFQIVKSLCESICLHSFNFIQYYVKTLLSVYIFDKSINKIKGLYIQLLLLSYTLFANLNIKDIIIYKLL